jgi:cellulose synthase (UDP-forming)
MLAFAAIWFTLPGRWQHPVLYVLASLIVAYHASVWMARWLALQNMERPRHTPPEAGLRVAVATGFVPGAEPMAMLEQTATALVAMEYPHDTWVLDEGDDPRVRALCHRLGAHHFTRKNLAQYQAEDGLFESRTKHGNYNSWLAEVVLDRYDVVVAVDTDHVPERDYLERTLGHLRDQAVGYVQAPQVFYNQDASFVARGAAEETYAFYSSHQMASFAMGEPIVTGSHSVHRVAALREVGGFPAHDAEDLYITMLYRAAAWRGVYVPEILALGTTPVDWSSYLGQQARWARAVLDLKLRVYPQLAGRLPLMERLITLMHGAYFLRALTYFVAYIMLAYMLVTNTSAAFLSRNAALAVVGLSAALYVIDLFRQRYYLDPARERGLHWRAMVLQYAKWPHLVGAVWDTLRGRNVRYVLTRKTESQTRHWVLARAHVLAAAGLAVAWIVGTVVHGATRVPLSLQLTAATFVVTSLTLAWSERLRFPPPYEPDRYARRRAEMAEIFKGRRSG